MYAHKYPKQQRTVNRFVLIWMCNNYKYRQWHCVLQLPSKSNRAEHWAMPITRKLADFCCLIIQRFIVIIIIICGQNCVRVEHKFVIVVAVDCSYNVQCSCLTTSDWSRIILSKCCLSPMIMLCGIHKLSKITNSSRWESTANTNDMFYCF